MRTVCPACGTNVQHLVMAAEVRDSGDLLLTQEELVDRISLLRGLLRQETRKVRLAEAQIKELEVKS